MAQETVTWVLATMIGMAFTLGHAVRTLYRMREKVLYPLLRIRSKEGHCSPVVTARSSRPAMHIIIAEAGYQS
jgi:hypothetical protein